jgi:hypothetical protein
MSGVKLEAKARGIGAVAICVGIDFGALSGMTCGEIKCLIGALKRPEGVAPGRSCRP